MAAWCGWLLARRWAALGPCCSRRRVQGESLLKPKPVGDGAAVVATQGSLSVGRAAAPHRGLAKPVQIESQPPALQGEEKEAVHRWLLGADVERLMDDMSDIWLGARVVGLSDGGLYSVEYADDGTIEHEVEGSELRPRKRRWDVPVEVWVCLGSCMSGKEELASFEAIGRLPRAASVSESQMWWCASYHDRFGRCGPRCGFVVGAAGRASLNDVVRRCAQAAAEGWTTADRKPWKERYLEQERLDSSRRSPEQRRGSLGDSAYAFNGKKVDYSNPMQGWFFDPRLGKMVKEC